MDFDTDVTVSSNVETPEAILANFALEKAPVEPVETPPAVEAAAVVEPVAPAVVEPVDPDAISERHADGTFKSTKEIREEFTKRLKKQTWQLRETERKLADAGKAPEAVAPVVAAAPVEPKAAAFTFDKWDAYSTKHPDDSYEDYIYALTDARTDFNLQADRARVERDSAALASQQTLHNLTTLGRRDHADFDAVMSVAMDAGASYSALLTDAILDDPEGHSLAYRLAKDPAALKTLSAITSPGALARALAPFLAVSTASAGSVAPPPITKATAPIKPVGSAPSTADPTEITGDEDVDEHIRKGNALDRVRGRTR